MLVNKNHDEDQEDENLVLVGLTSILLKLGLDPENTVEDAKKSITEAIRRRPYLKKQMSQILKVAKNAVEQFMSKEEGKNRVPHLRRSQYAYADESFMVNKQKAFSGYLQSCRSQDVRMYQSQLEFDIFVAQIRRELNYEPTSQRERDDSAFFEPNFNEQSEKRCMDVQLEEEKIAV